MSRLVSARVSGASWSVTRSGPLGLALGARTITSDVFASAGDELADAAASVALTLADGFPFSSESVASALAEEGFQVLREATDAVRSTHPSAVAGSAQADVTADVVGRLTRRAARLESIAFAGPGSTQFLRWPRSLSARVDQALDLTSDELAEIAARTPARIASLRDDLRIWRLLVSSAEPNATIDGHLATAHAPAPLEPELEPLRP